MPFVWRGKSLANPFTAVIACPLHAALLERLSHRSAIQIMQEFSYRLQYAGLRLIIAFFALLGLERASHLGGTLARRIGPRLGVSRRARRNLRHAMPELDDAAVEKIIADMWGNLGRTIAEYAHLDWLASAKSQDHLEIVDAHHAEEARAFGKGIIFWSGHFSNWEMMPFALRRLHFNGGEVYRHANNPYVDAWIIKLRHQCTGLDQIQKGPRGVRNLLRILDQGDMVAMLIDQKMNDGVETRFFGQKAMTTSAPGSMAVRYGITLVPTYLERVEGTKFRMLFFPPIRANPEAETFGEIMRLTQTMNDFLEARIRERPHEWLWMHNRWPLP